MATTEPSPSLAGSAAPPPEQPDEARPSAELEPSAANPEARPPAPAPPSLGAAAPLANRMSLSALLGSATLGEESARPGGRPGPETFRLRFRQFRYQDAAGPREAFRQLRELSRQWLRPDIRTKEQIMEMLVQEQLLAIMPEEMRARQRRRVSVRVTG